MSASGTDLVSRSAQGASLLIGLVLLQRIVTFTMNTLITRTVSAEVLGFASSDMELLLATVLFLSREGFRLIAIRVRIPETGPARPRRQQELVNIAWGPVLLGAPLCVLAAAAVSLPAVTPTLEDPARLSALLFVAGAAFETLAEPVYVLATHSLEYGPRTTAEGLGVVVKCGATLALLHLGWGVEAFGAAQLAYGAVLAAVYWRWALVQGAAVLGGGASLLPSRVAAGPAGTAGSADAGHGEDVAADGALLSPQAWGLLGSFSAQNVTKHLLTESNRLVLLSAPVSLRGEFAAVTNYGSLAVRLLLYPIEDAARTVFAALANDDGRGGEEAGTGGDEEDSLSEEGAEDEGWEAADARRRAVEATRELRRVVREQTRQARREASMRSAGRLLVLALRLMVTVGLLLALLGPPYCGTLVRLLLGDKWRGTGVAGGLASYCFYVLCLALNGVSEAFAMATAPRAAVWWLNVSMVGTFCAFVIIALGDPLVTETPGLLSLLGIRGLILADSINVLLRAGAALLTARDVVQERTGDQLDLASASPTTASLIVLVLAGGAVRASAFALGGGPEGGEAASLAAEAAHVAVGAVAGIACLGALYQFDGAALRAAYASVRGGKPKSE